MAEFDENQDDDVLSFLLTPKPEQQRTKNELPFPAGSFAEDCVLRWLDEADKIDSGELKFPGTLGAVISRVNRAAVSEALGDPFKFMIIAESAARADFDAPAPTPALLPPAEGHAAANLLSGLTPAEAAELARRLDTFQTRASLNK